MVANPKIVIAIVVVIVLVLVVYYAYSNCHLGRWSKSSCSAGFCSDPPGPHAEAQAQALQQANGGAPTPAPPRDDPEEGGGDAMFERMRNRSRKLQSQRDRKKDHARASAQNPGYVEARKARFMSVRGVDQFAGAGADHFGGPEGGGHGWFDPDEEPDRQQRHFDEGVETCTSRCMDGCGGSSCDAMCREGCQDATRSLGLLNKAHSPESFGFRT